MSRAIKNYALIGDCESAALVSSEGSIDFLCWPRFYSAACFAALLGDESNGTWALNARRPVNVRRRYREQTAILETRIVTETGAATVIDFMPIRKGTEDRSSLVRIVVGETGRVEFQMLLNLRFDYGHLRPWLFSNTSHPTEFLCGPDAVTLETTVSINSEDLRCMAEFEVRAGERKSFVLRYRPSHREISTPLDPCKALAATERFWREWTSTCTYAGPASDAVLRSLITIKALTSLQTGCTIAAPTLGLPERLGGQRNWDYRFCWLRDATFALLALLHSGFHKEASAWRDWLLRAVAAMPNRVQPLYGVAGEHRLPEWEIDWLGGFHHSRPVRAGNAAYQQLQLDAYGEVLDLLHQCRQQGIPAEDWSWRLQHEIVLQLEQMWQEPDAGIWEARHGRERFTHSRVMAWVALDRAIRAAERHRLDWPLQRWRKVRSEIHREVCERGYDAEIGGFVRSYETREPDASTLMIPLVGFLPADDPRMLQTVDLIERKLMNDGFVMRYDTHRSKDGLPQGEGAFVACSFWYLDNLILQGRRQEACRMFDKLLAIRNDVGILSEEYDPETDEMLGNFPQALSHLSLVNSAHNLAGDSGPAHSRSGIMASKTAGSHASQ